MPKFSFKSNIFFQYGGGLTLRIKGVHKYFYTNIKVVLLCNCIEIIMEPFKVADLNRYTFCSMFSNEKVYLFKSAHFISEIQMAAGTARS